MSTSPLPGIALLALLIGSAVRGDVVTINPVADTGIFEFVPDTNYGHQPDVPSGRLGFMAGRPVARALYKFDIAGAVPAGATITEAKMLLHVTKTPSGGETSAFALHRVLVDWGEGEGFGEIPDGTPAIQAGGATWNNRFHHTDGSKVPWSIPGGAFGVDFAATPSAEFSGPVGTGKKDFEFDPSGVSDLQSMLDHPAQNYGWVLRSMDESTAKTARRWSTREGPEATTPDYDAPLPLPELEITWTMPAIPPEITGTELDLAAREFSVRVAGLAGQSYQLQTSGTLLSWAPGETQTPAVDGELVFTLPLTPPTNFVRIEASLVP